MRWGNDLLWLFFGSVRASVAESVLTRRCAVTPRTAAGARAAPWRRPGRLCQHGDRPFLPEPATPCSYLPVTFQHREHLISLLNVIFLLLVRLPPANRSQDVGRWGHPSPCWWCWRCRNSKPAGKAFRAGQAGLFFFRNQAELPCGVSFLRGTLFEPTNTRLPDQHRPPHPRPDGRASGSLRWSWAGRSAPLLAALRQEGRGWGRGF